MSARLVLRRLGAAAVLCMGVAVAGGTLILHIHAAVVLSPSMRPDFDPGDLIITRPIPVAAVKPGMVVEFTPPGQAAVFAHRVMTVTRDAGVPVITTRGVANPAPDPWHARLDGATAPEVIAVVPKLGYAVNALHHRDERLALIGLLGVLLTCLAASSTYTRTLARATTRPT